MPRRNTKALQDRSAEPDEEVGLWIQRSLEELVWGKEPGEDVWRRVRQRIEECSLRSMTAVLAPAHVSFDPFDASCGCQQAGADLCVQSQS